MNNNQMFFALVGVMLTLFALAMGFIKYYIDAKIDPVAKQVDLLVQYMVEHQGKIATLEERTKLK